MLVRLNLDYLKLPAFKNLNVMQSKFSNCPQNISRFFEHNNFKVFFNNF